jgi:hypothetical protein
VQLLVRMRLRLSPELQPPAAAPQALLQQAALAAAAEALPPASLAAEGQPPQALLQAQPQRVLPQQLLAPALLPQLVPATLLQPAPLLLLEPVLLRPLLHLLAPVAVPLLPVLPLPALAHQAQVLPVAARRLDQGPETLIQQQACNMQPEITCFSQALLRPRQQQSRALPCTGTSSAWLQVQRNMKCTSYVVDHRRITKQRCNMAMLHKRTLLRLLPPGEAALPLAGQHQQHRQEQIA